MKKKKNGLFTPAFRSLFLYIPLFFGIAATLTTSLWTQAFPDSSLTAAILELPPALQAGVYPEPDEIPDGNIPSGSVEDEFLPAIIKILLALVSTVFLGALLVSGTFFIIHFGDEEKLKMAKGIMKWSVAGIGIVLVAYAIVQGVANLTFDK